MLSTCAYSAVQDETAFASSQDSLTAPATSIFHRWEMGGTFLRPNLKRAKGLMKHVCRTRFSDAFVWELLTSKESIIGSKRPKNVREVLLGSGSNSSISLRSMY